MIVGHDITNKFDVAFNWINETNLDTGHWEFGYALGFNYALVGEANQEAESTRPTATHAKAQGGKSKKLSSVANSMVGSATARSG